MYINLYIYLFIHPSIYLCVCVCVCACVRVCAFIHSSINAINLFLHQHGTDDDITGLYNHWAVLCRLSYQGKKEIFYLTIQHGYIASDI